MSRVARFSHESFQSLVRRRVIQHPATHLSILNCGPIPHEKHCEYPTFPLCKMLLVNNCDQSWVENWLRPKIFPRIEHIWMFHTHPYIDDLHLRFMKPWGASVIPQFYVHAKFANKFRTTKATHELVPSVIFLPISQAAPAAFDCEEDFGWSE